MNLHLKPLCPPNLETFKELLGSAEFGGCFCAVWTGHDQSWSERCADKSQPNFLITKKNVESGLHAGFLVYEQDNLIGWTGSGPKTAFPWLREKLASRLSDFNEKIWSIGCLAIAERYRGMGYAGRIVSAILTEATRFEAECVEAYPTRTYHEPRVFRGSYRLYKELGFKEISFEKDGEFEIVLMKYELLNL